MRSVPRQRISVLFSPELKLLNSFKVTFHTNTFNIQMFEDEVAVEDLYQLWSSATLTGLWGVADVTFTYSLKSLTIQLVAMNH